MYKRDDQLFEEQEIAMAKKWGWRIVVGAIVLAGLIIFLGPMSYLLKEVEQEEIGIQFEGGRIIRIVGPGVYSDVGLFVKMIKVSGQAVPFTVEDPEIITKDKQRLGLQVSGDIFRPGLSREAEVREKWAQYKSLYLDDELLLARVSDFAKQAMKVCVGDRNFDESIIGTARDDLRTCVDEELDSMASQFAIHVQNVTVPNVIISPEVQAALDSIVQSRLATDKAAQDELKARAEAAAEQARQEGEIMVEQSRIQEQTRQQTMLAQLEQQRLSAQLSVIEATRANDLAQLETERQKIEKQKANDLLAAERDLEINTVMARTAAEKARTETATDAALAAIYAANPGLLQLRTATVNASALSRADKLIFLETGMVPNLVFGGGAVPTVSVGE